MITNRLYNMPSVVFNYFFLSSKIISEFQKRFFFHPSASSNSEKWLYSQVILIVVGSMVKYFSAIRNGFGH